MKEESRHSRVFAGILPSPAKHLHGLAVLASEHEIIRALSLDQGCKNVAHSIGHKHFRAVLILRRASQQSGPDGRGRPNALKCCLRDFCHLLAFQIADMFGETSMKLRIILIGLVIAIGSATPWAQDKQPENGTALESITVPAGTKIPLILKQGITTKNAHVGDPVYAQTSFPVTMNDHIVVPSGTLVQGEILRVQRPGRVKGRAELLMNLTSMIFPNGYTIRLPGAVHGTPGNAGTNGVKDKEGTIAGDSGKGNDVGTIVGTAIPGAGIGAIADQGSGKGAAIGAASGGALGLATVLLTRGPEIHLGAGDSVEMVLERNLIIEQNKVHRVGQ